ncbi:aldolase [Streptosporangium sp. NBC_01639]|uniref:DUF6986 family protein n=1 Tax=Streptosporangium sp. NBC_01639 TaxID=2975948 RepID=UPI00386E6BA7|nr:aldolase [Streptosporangium sp. NBC_01639]
MRVTLGDPQALIPGFEQVHREQSAAYPATAVEWQPVHTVYVPADRFDAGTVAAWGAAALDLLRRHLSRKDMTRFFEMHEQTARTVHEKVTAKLGTDPIEDLRVDFEDGYGLRPAEEEDGHVTRAAEAIAALHAAGTLPRRWGLRVKSFADGDPVRSIRTLDGFLTEVIDRVGQLPDGFVVTFPKVLMKAYLGQFAGCLEALEKGLGLTEGRLRFEMQVEAPQTVRFLDAALVTALGGRLAAAHFGVFDYTASCSLPPHEQRLDHPACDHARHVMQTSFAGTGVELSDGSMAAFPAADDRYVVRNLWWRHVGLIRHSLSHGFYQGWDMHPSHLVSRYVAVYHFHLSHYEEYAQRVRAWEEQRGAEGGVMDEPATVKTMVTALRRADLALGNA